MPVGNPAPPRPRSFAAVTSAITCSGERSSAAASPATPSHAPDSNLPACTRLDATTACGGTAPTCNAATIAGMSAGASDVSTMPLTNADGSWSAMPISLVHPRVNAPSAVVSPTAMPSAAAASSGVPRKQGVERHHVLDFDFMDLQPRRNCCDGSGVDAAKCRLHPMSDIHQTGAITGKCRNDALYRGFHQP